MQKNTRFEINGKNKETGKIGFKIFIKKESIFKITGARYHLHPLWFSYFHRCHSEIELLFTMCRNYMN